MKYLFIIFSITYLLLSQGCANPKKMVYFQGDEIDSTSIKNQDFVLRFKTGDLISFKVYGADMQLVQSVFPNLSDFGENTTGVYFNDNPQSSLMMINDDGDVLLPSIGRYKIAGKTKKEVEDELAILYNPVIGDVTIFVRLRNFRVTILGDVQKPGAITVLTERLSLLEALGIAGDLQITAKRKNIMVVREENGEKKIYTIDLTNREIFNSPVYFLQQNDIVYVEPNLAKLNTSKFSPVYSVLISVTSLIITTVILITN